MRAARRIGRNMTDNPQHERLRTAIAQFLQAFDRVPTVIFDADGVIYAFEPAYLAHHNRRNPDLPPVHGPFTNWDLGHERTPEVADALQESMRTLDWSDCVPYPDALTTIPLLLELGLDLSVATAHRVDNVYSPSAKIWQFHENFHGLLDNRVQVGIDKTRVVGDFLIDDKPEVTGVLTPQWEHVYFTQEYNKHLPGPRASWDDMVEVLAGLIESKLPDALSENTEHAETALIDTSSHFGALSARRKAEADLEEQQVEVTSNEAELDTEQEPVVAELTETSTDDTLAAVAMPWEDEEQPELLPVVDVTWDDLIKGGDDK